MRFACLLTTIRASLRGKEKAPFVRSLRVCTGVFILESLSLSTHTHREKEREREANEALIDDNPKKKQAETWRAGWHSTTSSCLLIDSSRFKISLFEFSGWNGVFSGNQHFPSK